jgi:hypothetical protein
MTGTSKKRTPAVKAPGNQGDISIGGDVGGTGNVVGHGSSSNVQVNQPPEKARTPRHRPSSQRKGAQERLTWVRLLAFLLALAGTLAAIAIFVQLLQAIEAWAVVQFVLAAIVAALGISGTIKPQAVVDLLAKMLGKG